MNKDDTKQAIIGFTELMKGITGNKELRIPEDIAKEYGIEQEPCKDTISRQAVLDTISETWRHICYVAPRRKPTKGEEAVYIDIRETVKQLPSVNPKQRTGHWITLGNHFWKCSECRCDEISTSNWCPNCGAKMSENPTGSESEGEG